MPSQTKGMAKYFFSSFKHFFVAFMKYSIWLITEEDGSTVSSSTYATQTKSLMTRPCSIIINWIPTKEHGTAEDRIQMTHTHTNTRIHAQSNFKKKKNYKKRLKRKGWYFFLSVCVCVSLKRNAEAAITLGHIFTCSAKAAQANLLSR